MLTNAYADQVASHGEVAVFRAKKQAAINNKKLQLGTQLEVVGALGVLADELASKQLDSVTFSRLVLGMMIGNGYRDGVTTNLKASTADRANIEGFVKLAASHMNGPNLEENQIWAAQINPAAQTQHLNVLNKWISEQTAKAAPPYFNHEPRAAEPYRPLDQIIAAICQSFNDTPSQAMIQSAQRLFDPSDYGLMVKQFVLAFSELSAADQQVITNAYDQIILSLRDEHYGVDADDDALQMLMFSCNSTSTCKTFVQDTLERQAAELVGPCIDTIPNNRIQNLSPTGSTLQQRERIRDFLAILNPPAAPDPRAPAEAPERLTLDQKKMCLDVLFSRKLNRLIPADASVVQHNIRILIEQIVLNPAIKGRAAIAIFLDSNLSAQLRNCLNAILRLPDVARDIHYKALIERIRQMRPVINPAGVDSKEDLQQAFNVAQNRLINTLIQNRIAAITPPRELISPAPVVANPNGAVDHADNLNFIVHEEVIDLRNYPFNSGLPHDVAQLNGRLLKSEYDFESRLIHFLINHWAAYYKPEIPDDINTDRLKQALQVKFDAINNIAGISIVEKKRRKIVLIESILYRLLSHVQQPLPADLPQPPSLENALSDMGIPLAEVNQHRHEHIVVPVREQINHAKRQRRDTITPLLINPMLAIINAVPVPENHVYTSMEAIKALPSIDWDDELTTHVFNGHPALCQQAGETDIVYWRRIGTHLIRIYNQKIKPHIYPDGLQATLNRNEAPQLVPFAMMFSDTDDAANAINYPLAGHGNAQQQVLEFDITPGNLQRNPPVGIKQKLHDSYKKTHDFMLNSIQKLYCLPIVDNLPAALPWPFFSVAEEGRHRENIQEFTQERKELCKKLLLAFSYFDREGEHFADDMPMLASLIGRFTHCADGKKGAIESLSRLALKGLRSAIVAAADDDEGAGLELGEADLDTFLKQIILVDFKNDTITAVADHNHPESVSIITNIKFRHKDFWNVPTNSQAQYPNYTATDYAYNQAGHDNVDIILRYFYQHIYAGPHELVNKIHAYLRSVDAHKRANFLGFVSVMLGRHPPFADWTEDGIDYTHLVKQRYCEVLNQAEVVAAIQAARAQALIADEDENEAQEEAIANTADYIFTRKGIETILFYAGYFAWNGPAGQHPLIADWNANLAWLYNIDREKYNAIYNVPPH